MSQKEKILETFKSKNVGRGAWNVMHTSISSFIKERKEPTLKIFDIKFKIMILHIFFLIYCKHMFCEICHKHAFEFMSLNIISDQLTKENSEMIYFEWLVKFHNKANENAGKTQNVTVKDVFDYYVNGIENNHLKNNDFEFKYIESGIWHFFFTCTSNIRKYGQISALYFLIVNFMKNLEDSYKYLFMKFISEHNFTKALDCHDISEEELCVVFFEWLYSLYKYMNTELGITIFPLNELKEVYYTSQSCNDDCGK